MRAIKFAVATTVAGLICLSSALPVMGAARPSGSAVGSEVLGLTTEVPARVADVGAVNQVLTSSADAAKIQRETLAKEYGVTPEVIEERTRHSVDFSILAEKLQELFPSQFSYAAGQGPSGSPTVIAFKGDIPEQAKALVAAAGFPIELIGSMPVSAQDRSKASTAALDGLWNAIKPQSSTAEFPPGSSNMVLFFSGGSSMPNEQLRTEPRSTATMRVRS